MAADETTEMEDIILGRTRYIVRGDDKFIRLRNGHLISGPATDAEMAFYRELVNVLSGQG